MANLDDEDVRLLENAYPLMRDTGFPALVRDLDYREVFHHQPVVSPGRSDGPAGKLPPIANHDALSFISFNGVAGAQEVFRMIKIAPNFIGTPAIHIHWTKTDDLDRSGETVRWRVSYSVYDGEGGIVPASTVIDFDDTYTDDGTSTHAVYETPWIALVGVTARYYMSIKVEKATPSGSAMAAPGIVAVDFTYIGYANR